LLAEPGLVGQPAEVILAALARRPGSPVTSLAAGPSFLSFAASGATYPRHSHAAWFFAQMVRWGQVRFDRELMEKATSVYRSDIYRGALATLDVPMPDAENAGGDAFFDGRTFDAADVAAYLRLFSR